MSKPLPPASGIPVKVVVRASDNRIAEAFAKNNAMQGELKRFVGGARQQMEGRAVGRTMRQFPTGIMQFTKNGGQEQLIVDLTTPRDAAEGSDAQRDLTKTPDFCVVDVVLASATDTSANFLARAVEPELFREQPFRDELELDYADPEPSYSEGKEPGEALIQYSRYEIGDETLPITDRVSSLKFDLRNIPPGDRVVVELWGRHFTPNNTPSTEPVKEFENPPTLLETRQASAFRDNGEPEYYWPDGSGSPHDGQFPDPLGNPTPFTNPLFASIVLSAPNLLFAAMFSEWIKLDEWDETEYRPAPSLGYRQKRFDPDTGQLLAERRLSYGFSGSTIVGVSTTEVQWTLRFFEQTRLWPAPGDDNDEEARDVDIVSAFYWDEPLLIAAETEHEDGAGIWALGDDIPERTKIGEGVLEGSDTPDSVEFTSNSDKLSRIGTVTVDRIAATVEFVPG